MLRTDALAGKNRISPEVLDAVTAALAAAPGRRFKLVANLPYQIATPLLSNLLALDRPPETMTCTLQKEVAQRIAARPGTKDYGGLAIWVQIQCRTQLVRVLPPAVFWPRPKVSSAFVQITLEPERRAKIPDRAYFHAFVRKVFSHRRKALRGELLAAFPKLSKPDVDRLLAAQGLAGMARAEQLDPEAMLSLVQAVRDEEHASA
jgi:16S rRNA (adenine1518-N6/adenine1519-N6)-dimethyltransferase